MEHSKSHFMITLALVVAFSVVDAGASIIGQLPIKYLKLAALRHLITFHLVHGFLLKELENELFMTVWPFATHEDSTFLSGLIQMPDDLE